MPSLFSSSPQNHSTEPRQGITSCELTGQRRQFACNSATATRTGCSVHGEMGAAGLINEIWRLGKGQSAGLLSQTVSQNLLAWGEPERNQAWQNARLFEVGFAFSISWLRIIYVELHEEKCHALAQNYK